MEHWVYSQSRLLAFWNQNWEILEPTRVETGIVAQLSSLNLLLTSEQVTSIYVIVWVGQNTGYSIL